MRLGVEQRLRGHQDAGRAVPALRRAEIREALLEGMETAVFDQPLDGRDLPSARLGGEHQAGEHGLPVDENRARAALTELAAVLRARELQVLAQHLEERLVVVGEDVDGLAVHGAGQAESSWRSFLERTTDNVRVAAGLRLAMPRTR